MHTQNLIPGAYERNTLTSRQPGSMGGAAFGSADAPVGPSSLNAATIADRELEGGGGVSQRPRRVLPQAQVGGALADTELNKPLSTMHSWFQVWWRLAHR